MNKSLRQRYLWIAVLLAVAVVWFGSLNYRTLVRPDEGRYAEIPREMVASGDWLTPRLTNLKYFEKPPLQYWATATAYVIAGEHQWTARIWPALTSFLGILLAFYTGRRLWGNRAGTLAAAILGSAVMYNALGHVITLDMGLSFFLQLTWTCFMFGQSDDKRQQRWIYLAWAALALAVLSKGLVAIVLIGGTFLIYTVIQRDAGPWKRLKPISGLLIFLAIAAPWFWLVSKANPEFAHFFFIHEHFERFLTKAHHRYQSNWYFVAIYLLFALPWTFLLLQALYKSWFKTDPGKFQPMRFLIVWIAFTFLFFSFSSSKLVSYILPIFPALALLGGRMLMDISSKALSKHFVAIAVVALVGIVGSQLIHRDGDEQTTVAMLTHYGYWLLVGMIALLLSALGGIRLLKQERKMPALLLLAVGGFIAGSTALLGHESLSRSNSSAEIALATKPYLKEGIPVYSVLQYEQTFAFYAQTTLTLVDYRDELNLGLNQEPQKGINTVDEFKAKWLASKEAIAIMSLGTYRGLGEQGLPMAEIARDNRNVTVRRP